MEKWEGVRRRNGGKLFFIEDYSLMWKKRELKKKNHHFATRCDSSKDHQRILKLLSKMLSRVTGYSHGLKVSHGLCFLNDKENEPL